MPPHRWHKLISLPSFGSKSFVNTIPYRPCCERLLTQPNASAIAWIHPTPPSKNCNIKIQHHTNSNHMRNFHRKNIQIKGNLHNLEQNELTFDTYSNLGNFRYAFNCSHTQGFSLGGQSRSDFVRYNLCRCDCFTTTKSTETTLFIFSFMSLRTTMTINFCVIMKYL